MASQITRAETARSEEEVGLQQVFAEDVKEGLLPAGIEHGVHVEHEPNQGVDVRDRDSLRIKVEESGGLLLEQCSFEGIAAGIGAGVVVRVIVDMGSSTAARSWTARRHSAAALISFWMAAAS
jgi:hypothetical protein